MGKKKFARTNEIKSLLSIDSVKVSEGAGNCLFFEVCDICTTDICEAVALMMRSGITDPNIWNKDITKNLDLDSVDTRNCLYWLSGGDDEWNKRNYYKRPWNECDLLFQEEFGITILVLLKKSKTLGDIKSGFIKFLNLPIFYEFALSKNII